MSDLNFDISVAGDSYTGSDRAKKAEKAATQSGMHTPFVGEGPKAVADGSDNANKTASTNDNLKRSKQTVLNPMTKPAKGAMAPDEVNAMQRP